MDLEIIANTPKVFVIDGKDYKVQALNLLELSDVRQYLIDKIKTDYKKDVSDMVAAIDPKERKSFVFDSLKQKVSEEEINDRMFSKEGLIKILSVVLKIPVEMVQTYLADSKWQTVLLDVIKFVLGITDEVVSEEVVEEEVVPTEKKTI